MKWLEATKSLLSLFEASTVKNDLPISKNWRKKYIVNFSFRTYQAFYSKHQLPEGKNWRIGNARLFDFHFWSWLVIYSASEFVPHNYFCIVIGNVYARYNKQQHDVCAMLKNAWNWKSHCLVTLAVFIMSRVCTTALFEMYVISSLHVN